MDTLIVNDLGIVEKLREIESLRYVPIVLMCPGMPQVVMKICIDLGISSYINFPVIFPELVNALHTAMESYANNPSDANFLAEDNIVNQKLAVRILERFGHKITIVPNGKMALDEIMIKKFDLVLMDVQMPIMGGFEATQMIRKWESKQSTTSVFIRTPIIALTAHAMIGDREKCIAAGMDDYVTKPLRFNELISAINKSTAKPTKLAVLENIS